MRNSDSTWASKISVALGTIAGAGLISTIVYTILTLNQRPADFSGAPPILLLLLVSGLVDSFIMLAGTLVLLFAHLDSDRRGVLGFLVFIASIIGIVGSVIILNYSGL